MSEWKVDPDTRRRLLQLQKSGSNKKCVDCGSPSPQWASPKFGIFICLECAGIHRGLGVHISFVRSITMDQFKPEELLRMENGGNEKFLEYLDSYGIDAKLPQKFKYDNPVVADYREMLTVICEGKEWTRREYPDFDPAKLIASSSASPRSNSGIIGSSIAGSPSPPAERIESRRVGTPQQGSVLGATGTSASSTTSSSPGMIPGQPTDDLRTKNEAYFAELGKKNQEKPNNLPPSKGGRYQGFGNTTSINQGKRQTQNGASSDLSLDNLQKDPWGTLSKGWGLFSHAVTKSVEEVNESVIKPGVQQWQSGELSTDAQRAAQQFGQKFQETSTSGISAFSRWTKNLQQGIAGIHNPDHPHQSNTSPSNMEQDSKYSKLFDSLEPSLRRTDDTPTQYKQHQARPDKRASDTDGWEDF